MVNSIFGFILQSLIKLKLLNLLFISWLLYHSLNHISVSLQKLILETCGNSYSVTVCLCPYAMHGSWSLLPHKGSHVFFTTRPILGGHLPPIQGVPGALLLGWWFSFPYLYSVCIASFGCALCRWQFHVLSEHKKIMKCSNTLHNEKHVILVMDIKLAFATILLQEDKHCFIIIHICKYTVAVQKVVRL